MTDFYLRADSEADAQAAFATLGIVGEESLSDTAISAAGTLWALDVIGKIMVPNGEQVEINGTVVDLKSPMDGFYMMLRWIGSETPPDLPQGISLVWQTGDGDPPAWWPRKFA